MVVKHGSVPRRWKRILSQLMFRLINYSEARVTRRRKRKEGRKEEYIGVGREEMGLQRIFSESRKEYYTRGGGEACTSASSRKTRINGSVFNHRDIQLTTFAPGGESSFQQKHKANRMRRLQSCSPCALQPRQA